MVKCFSGEWGGWTVGRVGGGGGGGNRDKLNDDSPMVQEFN